MKSVKNRVVFLCLVGFLAASCDCGQAPPGKKKKDASPALEDSGVAADVSGVDGFTAADAGQSDALSLDRWSPPADPFDPDNANKDSDCDGLSDAEEFGNVYPGGGGTNPDIPDSDGDGVEDGVELGRTSSPEARCSVFFSGDADPSTQTNPALADSDGDQIADGDEDRNGNGQIDSGECNPNSTDSDGDALPDQLEDSNHNGVVDPGETNACARDTDGDGIPDGVEDVNQNGATDSGETNPRNPDSDSDGLLDGDEDLNWNHVVDANETDPLVADLDSDGDGILDAVELALGLDPNMADTDGDGLEDGVEEKNQDGLVNSGETDPLSADSDCDGLADGDEDANHNGQRDNGETDALDADSDGDLLSDGLESGATSSPDTTCNFVGDADTSSTTDPLLFDSDGDGMNDGIEDANQNGRMDSADRDTDPNNADTDGDLLLDGAEDRNFNHVVDVGETDPLVADIDTDGDGISDPVETAVTLTDPTDPDTDGDGLWDGVEDKNHDGLIAATETNPLLIDSDCDGLADGDEDNNHNGVVDSGETEPYNADSDGDGITDGVEAGVAVNPDPANCPDVELDQDPSTTTDGTDADSDNDGLSDGAEDMNQNGRVDDGELDPNNGSEDLGPAAEACSAASLTPLQFRDVADADALLALATTYANGAGGVPINLSLLTVNSQVRGFLFYDPTHQVGGFLLEKTPDGATAVAEETALRGDTPCSGVSGRLQQIACLDNPVTQVFTTWDGFDAVRGRYDWRQGVGDDLKGRLNRVAKELLGAQVTGLFSDGNEGNAGHAEAWRLELEVLRRSGQRAVVMGAISTLSKIEGGAADPVQRTRLADVVNGSALGQIGDRTFVQCDRAYTSTPKIDFLWVVDDSCSMGPYQAAVARAATAFVNKLGNSQVDFRAAVIGTSYWQERNGSNNTGDPIKNYGVVLGFTSDLATFQSYLAQPCPLSDLSCLGDEQCTGREKGIESAYDALLNPMNGAVPMLPTPAEGEPDHEKKLRFGAKLVMVFVADAGDQSKTEARYPSKPPSTASDGPWWPSAPSGTWLDIFDDIAARPDINGILAGSIICTNGSCGNETANPSLFDDFVSQYQGVLGDIRSDASIDAAIEGIVDAAIGSTGILLSRPPISASFKVVQENPPLACPQPTPRNPVNGFDYDGASNRISFFGDCRPQQPNTEVAISYQYWVKKTGGELPDCDPPLVYNPVTASCDCPTDCGGGVPGVGEVCDTVSCTFVCMPDCGGGCAGASTCNTTACSCNCPVDCGGSPPGPGFECNQQSCIYECTADCGGQAQPGANFVCDQASCAWVCPDDCGQTPQPGQLERCDATTCTLFCPEDCGGSCGARFSCNTTTCSCDCQQGMSCSQGYTWDSNACDCLCSAEGLDCGPEFLADTQACLCRCAPNCSNLCSAGTYCNESLCECLPSGG